MHLLGVLVISISCSDQNTAFSHVIFLTPGNPPPPPNSVAGEALTCGSEYPLNQAAG